MQQIIIALIGSVFGGAVTAFYSYKGKRLTNTTDSEKIYADHTDDLFARIDKLTDERDKSNREAVKLQAKVEAQTETISKLEKEVTEQSKIIDKLTRQIGELNEQIKKMNKLEREELNQNESSK